MRIHASSTCWSEVAGGKNVPLFAYEPDPNSFHEDFYYNTEQNRLYRLENIIDPCGTATKKSWIAINSGC
jgi:hypothetical protein